MCRLNGLWCCRYGWMSCRQSRRYDYRYCCSWYHQSRSWCCQYCYRSYRAGHGSNCLLERYLLHIRKVLRLLLTFSYCSSLFNLMIVTKMPVYGSQWLINCIAAAALFLPIYANTHCTSACSMSASVSWTWFF